MDVLRTPQPEATIDRFLDALTARDFEELTACFDPGAQARLLLPRGPDDLVGSEQISARMQQWFGAATKFEVLRRDQDEIGGRQQATWRFRLVRNGETSEVIEQTSFIDVGPEGIQRIDLLCSGFRTED